MKTNSSRHSIFFITGTIAIFLLMTSVVAISNRIVSTASKAAPIPACPPSFTVNSLGDLTDAAPGNMVCDDGLGNCTLRAAIAEANALGLCGVIDINFSVTGTINTGSSLFITHSVNVNGPGANLLTIANNNTAAVFDFITTPPVVSLKGLTITGGNGTALVAGGINNSCTLTIDRCIITGNTGNFVGGIQNYKSLTILNSTISNNTSNLGGFNA